MRRMVPLTLLAALLLMASLALVTRRAATQSTESQTPAKPSVAAAARVFPVSSMSAGIGPLFGVRAVGDRVYVEGRPEGSGNVAGFSTAGGGISAACSANAAQYWKVCPDVHGITHGGALQLEANGEVFLAKWSHLEREIELRAYPVGCHFSTIGDGSGADRTCHPLWTASGISSARLGLVAGDGMVFVIQNHGGCCGNTPGPHGGILAYPFDCGTGNATCDPVWSWGTGLDGDRSVPIHDAAVAGDRLYAASTDGRLYVFALR